MGNWLNILKSIEIPTSKPYTFLFLMCNTQDMQYISYGPWGHPPRNGNLLKIFKSIEIPTPKPYIFMFRVLQAIYAIHYILPLGSINPTS
jgi:hypothetical protein